MWSLSVCYKDMAVSLKHLGRRSWHSFHSLGHGSALRACSTPNHPNLDTFRKLVALQQPWNIQDMVAKYQKIKLQKKEWSQLSWSAFNVSVKWSPLWLWSWRGSVVKMQMFYIYIFVQSKVGTNVAPGCYLVHHARKYIVYVVLYVLIEVSNIKWRWYLSRGFINQ